MKEWMDISTAPRDGTLIDVWCVSPEDDEGGVMGIRLTDVGWSEASNFFQHTGWVRVLNDGDFDLVEGEAESELGLPPWTPIYWMPIPSGPPI